VLLEDVALLVVEAHPIFDETHDHLGDLLHLEPSFAR
jgi:hypothetical protein